MCRNIKPLFHFDPPATEEEIHLAALQFVRKVSGFVTPSAVNERAFDKAVAEVHTSVRQLIDSMETSAPFKNREIESQKAKARSAKRFGTH